MPLPLAQANMLTTVEGTRLLELRVGLTTSLAKDYEAVLDWNTQMTLFDEGFTEVSRTSGRVSVPLLGSRPYDAVNHINAEGTIAYAAIEAEGQISFAFVSRNSSRGVYTVPGPSTGPLDVPDVDMDLFTVSLSADVDTFYAKHLEHLGESAPVVDKEWLRTEVENLPQKAADMAVNMMQSVMSALGGAEGIGQMVTQMLSSMETQSSDAEVEAVEPDDEWGDFEIIEGDDDED